VGALRRVAVVFTGGTISMVVDPVAGGAVPALDGAAILARTAGLERLARVVAIDRGRKPASHWTFAELLDLVRAVRELVADPAVNGLVLVQGTDTIEETSFLLDLLVATSKPVVVTGAMRDASKPDYEGPANLRDAVAAAASEQLRDTGVVVVLAGTIDPADDVTKTHATALDTFRSLNAGRLGTVHEGRVVLERARGTRRPVLPVDRIAGPIPIVTATVGMDDAILDVLAATRPAGIVVAATGSGNTSPGLLAAAERAIAAGIPVVLASRSASGAAGTGYAFPGGGATWVGAGAMLAGTLTAPKARIALAVGLGAGLTDADLARFVAGPAPGR
jgi:L-asparaginase